MVLPGGSSFHGTARCPAMGDGINAQGPKGCCCLRPQRLRFHNAWSYHLDETVSLQQSCPDGTRFFATFRVIVPTRQCSFTCLFRTRRSFRNVSRRFRRISHHPPDVIVFLQSFFRRRDSVPTEVFATFHVVYSRRLMSSFGRERACVHEERS